MSAFDADTKDVEVEMSRYLKIYSDMRDRYRDLLPTKRGKNRWIFVTVRPPGRKSAIKQLCNHVKKVVKRSYVVKYAYVYEQTGDEKDLGYGFHCHLLFQYPAYKCFAAVEQSLLSTFMPIATGPGLFITTLKDDFVIDKYKYILGYKDTPEKLGHIKWDGVWRSKLGLAPIYVHSPSYWDSIKF